MLKQIARGFFLIFLSFTLSALIFATGAVIAGGIWAGTALDTSLDEELFFCAGRDRTTRLYYYDETGMASELTEDRISGYENSLYCPLGDMSPALKNAFIAIEDKRFYDHGGIDWGRSILAVKDMLTGGAGHFGGSTITQQLVKNLTGDSERSVRRKVSEMIRAAALERKMSKDEILEQYLNVVNLSESCYGVRTASNAYFSKEPKDLTAGEAATLAAITNNPSRYDPLRHPLANKGRRDLILSQMLAQGMLNSREYEDAVGVETTLHVNEKAFSGRVNSWFADLVVRDVIGDLVRQRGMSEAAASRLVYCGGLRIYSTVDPMLQRIVEAYYADETNFPVHTDGKRAQSAMMILDPESGAVLAVVGAVGKKESNRVQSYATDTRRPSGSVIKPLSVYAPALERGLITGATVFDDVPLQFRANGAPWPLNSPNIYRGLTNVSEALTQSVNTVSVSILEKMGKGASYRFLTEQLGFSSLDPRSDVGAAALALGQQHSGVTLSELLGGYTALAGGGIYQGVRSYYTVLDRDGRELLRTKGAERRVLDADNAAIMTMLLRQVTRIGTGKALRLTEKVDVAGKTGTSSKSCDKWFIGYTPELLAGVWYGHEYPEALTDVKGNPALNIFDCVMERIVEARPVRQRQFETAGELVAVRYCKDSGKLIGEACRYDPRGDRSEVGYFKRGTEPREYCGCHVCVDYCSCGGIACENCPAQQRSTVALLRIMRRFPRQIKVLDAPYTYGGPMDENRPDLLYNEPYYAISGGSKQNYGVGMDVVPFNRVCPVHGGADEFWRRRLQFS